VIYLSPIVYQIIIRTASSRLKQGKVNPVSQIQKLIVTFVRRDTKELFYKSRKHLKGITTKDIGLLRLPENKIYISESLSPRNREIFKVCLKFKERNYFKYTAICVQAQTANIFARLFTFETGRSLLMRPVIVKRLIQLFFMF
jgi:hypothetical protein